MVTVIRKQNDTLPPIRLQCVDADGVAVSLAAASSLRFIVQDETGTNIIDAAATADADQVNNKGWWSYTIQAGDLATAGRFLFEMEIDFAGEKQTFPTNGQGRLIVKGELG